MDHRPGARRTLPLDKGLVESKFQGGDARQGERHVSKSLRARETDHATGSVTGVQIGGWLGAALCFPGERGARGGFSEGQRSKAYSGIPGACGKKEYEEWTVERRESLAARSGGRLRDLVGLAFKMRGGHHRWLDVMKPHGTLRNS